MRLRVLAERCSEVSDELCSPRFIGECQINQMSSAHPVPSGVSILETADGESVRAVAAGEESVGMMHSRVVCWQRRLSTEKTKKDLIIK